MRTGVSILLLVIFLFNFCGYYILFVSAEADIHDSVTSSKISERDFEILYVNEKSADLIWLDEREIRFEGRYYDVYQMEKAGGVLKIHCVHDKYEEQLHAAMESHLEGLLSDVTKSKTKSKFSCPLLVVFPPTLCESLSASSALHSPLNCKSTENTFDVFFDVVVPPPQLFQNA